MYQWELTRKHSNILKPKLFDLNINYRSHNGILQLAASVVELIQHFFPNSIDQLSPERSEVDGPQPIIVDGFEEEYFKLFLDKNSPDEPCKKRKKQSSFVEFGADQVIIVRDEIVRDGDDDVKARVEKLIGKGAMVLTVSEAKGMEFNDVFLYNFFTNSPACRKV
jgi:ATP-dependent exoDNAse (exonuclease V) beta subunit